MDFALSRPATPDAGASVALGLVCAAAVVAGSVVGLGAAAVIIVAVARWARGEANIELLRGMGVGALVGLAAAKGLFASAGWGESGCSAFTTEPWRVAVLVAAVPSLLAVADPRLPDRRARTLAALGIGAVALAVAAMIAPGCFGR